MLLEHDAKVSHSAQILHRSTHYITNPGYTHQAHTKTASQNASENFQDRITSAETVYRARTWGKNCPEKHSCFSRLHLGRHSRTWSRSSRKFPEIPVTTRQPHSDDLDINVVFRFVFMRYLHQPERLNGGCGGGRGGGARGIKLKFSGRQLG